MINYYKCEKCKEYTKSLLLELHCKKCGGFDTLKFQWGESGRWESQYNDERILRARRWD